MSYEAADTAAAAASAVAVDDSASLMVSALFSILDSYKTREKNKKQSTAYSAILRTHALYIQLLPSHPRESSRIRHRPQFCGCEHDGRPGIFGP